MSERPDAYQETYWVGAHAMRVTVTAERTPNVDDLRASLAPLRCAFVLAAEGTHVPAVEIALRFVEARVEPPGGAPFGVGGVWLDDGGIVLDRGGSWVGIHYGSPITIDAVVPEEPNPTFTRWTLLLAIVVALRGLGLFHLHAGLVEGQTGGWLLVGPSGAGKSTTTVALAAAGMSPKADDVVLLAEADLQLAPVARPFHLDERALAAFPRWRELATRGNDGKFDVVVAPPQSKHIRVSALLLLGGPATQTAVSPCDPMDALVHVLSESGTLFVDPARAQRHLDTLRRLVESVPARTLRPGPDALSDPGRLRALIESSLRDG